MKEVKIIFSDYDGTIYTEDGMVEKNVGAIKEWHDNGGKFVIATGRGLTSAKKVIDQYGIPFDYCIINNGAVVVDSDYNLLLKLTIPLVEVKKIATFIRDNFSSEIEGIYYYGLGEKTIEPEDIVTKVRAQTIGRDHAPMQAVTDAINQSFPNVIAHVTLTDMYPLEQFPDSNYQIVDIGYGEAGKQHAMRFILEREGLRSIDATAIGDGANDIEMIKNYDGYALGGSVAAKMNGKITASVFELINGIMKARGL